jgi:hypothetical protein
MTLRVKWVGWLSQYSSWERDKEFEKYGKGFRLQGDLDAQCIELLVDDIQRRLKKFEKKQSRNERIGGSRYCCKFETAM